MKGKPKAYWDALGLGHVSKLPLGPIDTSYWDVLFPRTHPAKPPPCINLEERFPEYKVFWEDNGSYKDQVPREEWPSLMEFHGVGNSIVIWPHGHDILCVCGSGGGATIRRLVQLPFMIRVMGVPEGPCDKWGYEVRAWFHVDHAEEVFALCKLHRRRPKLSPEHRAVLEQASRSTRFRQGHKIRRGRRLPEG